MKTKKRTYNPRRVRTGQSYTIQDIAGLYGIHKNSVSHWLKNGLPLIDGQKPFMIHGDDLREFLSKKRTDRKHACKPDEFFCFKCRAPRTAWENVADIQIRDKKRLSISGLCAVCRTPVHRAGSVRKLAEYQEIFSIQTLREPRITDCSSPIVNSDMCKDKKHDQVQRQE